MKGISGSIIDTKSELRSVSCQLGDNVPFGSSDRPTSDQSFNEKLIKAKYLRHSNKSIKKFKK